jgi:hypothetical protein
MIRPHALRFAFMALVALSGMACNRVRVEDVRGPDGGDWVQISCKHMDKKCFRTAASICPSGYYFADSAGPARAHDVDADDEGSVRVTAPQPRAGVNAKTLAPQERWGSRMYSKKSGAILVQCAAATATN